MWTLINAQLNKSRINNHFNNMNPNNLNKFFTDLGLNARKDIEPINSFTKYMAPPSVNSKFSTKITETELIDIANQS